MQETTDVAGGDDGDSSDTGALPRYGVGAGCDCFGIGSTRGGTSPLDEGACAGGVAAVDGKIGKAVALLGGAVAGVVGWAVSGAVSAMSSKECAVDVGEKGARAASMESVAPMACCGCCGDTLLEAAGKATCGRGSLSAASRRCIGAAAASTG